MVQCDALRQFLNLRLLLRQRLAAVRRDRRTTETQTHDHFLSGGMDDQRIKPAGQRLGLLAEFCMDAASARRVEENTSAVILVSQPEVAALADDHRAGINAIGLGPALLFDALFIFRQKLDEQVTAAAVRATVTTPILNRRDLDAQ